MTAMTIGTRDREHMRPPGCGQIVTIAMPGQRQRPQLLASADPGLAQVWPNRADGTTTGGRRPSGAELFSRACGRRHGAPDPAPFAACRRARGVAFVDAAAATAVA